MPPLCPRCLMRTERSFVSLTHDCVSPICSGYVTDEQAYRTPRWRRALNWFVGA